jgi:hypothetical protein
MATIVPEVAGRISSAFLHKQAWRVHKVIGGVKREFCGGSSLLGDTGAARRTRDTRPLLLPLDFLSLGGA